MLIRTAEPVTRRGGVPAWATAREAGWSSAGATARRDRGCCRGDPRCSSCRGRGGSAGAANLLGVYVKICGLTDPGAVAAAVEAGADAIGLVMTASPRQITPERAAELAAAVPPEVL